MKIIFRLNIFLVALLLSLTTKSQTPVFEAEIDVTINGLTFDAMEPFISPTGNTLFFNNLNDGIDTKLFYATRVNDSTFNFIGEVNGTNQTVQPYLDAVPDLDSLNNFYWTSTRNYPTELNNLFHGTYNSGNVTDSSRVYGDFNKSIPRWLVMDHGISIDGQLLYFNNARFDNSSCAGPCETQMGIAQKLNDSTFNVIANSNAIMQTINDPNYIFYAPCITSDHLELYYTRYLAGTITASTLFEICVATRNSPTGNFSTPTVLFSDVIANLIEAPTLTVDKQIIYYHRKTTNSHKIVMRYRNNFASTPTKNNNNLDVVIHPNPMNSEAIIRFQNKNAINYNIELIDNLGKTIKTYNTTDDNVTISREELKSGIYFILFQNKQGIILTKKLVIR